MHGRAADSSQATLNGTVLSDLVKGAAPLPFVVEPAALSERRRENDEPALADGKHGTGGAIKVVVNVGRLVDDDVVGAVAPHRSFAARHTADPLPLADLSRAPA